MNPDLITRSTHPETAALVHAVPVLIMIVALLLLTLVLRGRALAMLNWQADPRIIEPYVQFFRTIPPLAIIPLAIVTMGIDETPKIFVIFLAAFLSSVVATYQGVISVDRTLINAARVLGAGDFTIFRRVVVPASTPYIMVGMRIGLGSSWATVVAAELIAAQSGLGYRMQQAQLYYDLPTIFVSLIAIGINQRLLHVHHRQVGQIAQFLDCLRCDRGHDKYSFVDSRKRKSAAGFEDRLKSAAAR